MSNKGPFDMPLKSFRRSSAATNSVVLFVLSIVSLNCRVNFADDWPQWRGPQRDNVSKETGLLKEWPEGGPRLHLRIEGFGVGIAAPAVVGQRAYTLGVYGYRTHTQVCPSDFFGWRRDRRRLKPVVVRRTALEAPSRSTRPLGHCEAYL